MQESRIDLDREEYLARLGVVLQLARKAARISQVTASERLGMTPVSFTRWESGSTGISAYDLARLVQMYGLELDADLVMRPPASKVEVKKRLGPIAAAARHAVRRGMLQALPGEPEGGGEP